MKNIFKKFIAFLLAVTASFALIACGGDNSSVEQSNPPENHTFNAVYTLKSATLNGVSVKKNFQNYIYR